MHPAQHQQPLDEQRAAKQTNATLSDGCYGNMTVAEVVKPTANYTSPFSDFLVTSASIHAGSAP
jgi:hypothetical protein